MSSFKRFSFIGFLAAVVLLASVASALPAPQEKDESHEAGNPFEFKYNVQDDETENDFGHEAKSDGEEVKGEYRTQLADGRLQVVKYVANWKTGYEAEVSYQGEAIHPEPTSTTKKPNPYEALEENDAVFIDPSQLQ